MAESADDVRPDDDREAPSHRSASYVKNRPSVSAGSELKLAYSVEEAASLISIGRTKLVALVSAGQIPSIKIDGRRLIPRQDLIDFINRMRAQGPTPNRD